MEATPPVFAKELVAKAMGQGVLSTVFVVPAALTLKADIPLGIQITLGILLWAVAFAFLLVAALLSLSAYKASKHLSLGAICAVTLPLVSAVLVAAL